MRSKKHFFWWTQTLLFKSASATIKSVGVVILMFSRFPSTINIGNPVEMTIKQMAETVRKITQSQSQFIYQNLPVDDPKQRRPDITLAKTLLKWTPKTDLETGLRFSLPYFKEKNQ